MDKISIDMFRTNRDMLSKDTLRYCESFYQYLFHLINFFSLSLSTVELSWLYYLVKRIEYFLAGAPTTDKYHAVVGRYSRLLPKLKRIYDEQSSKLESAE